MKKLAGWILSAPFYLAFGLFLLLFQPVQWVCYRWFGYAAHKRSVDLLNLCLFCCYYLLGNSVRFRFTEKLPQNRPVIFVPNHQSMYDIPPMIWHLRRHHAKFISKIELTSGILSISFNLKYGGGANIDRKDSKQALGEIMKLGERMKANTWSCIIFPEGTRSKDGRVKTFQIGGMSALIKKCPDAVIIPVAIQNSWKMVRYGKYPLGTGLRMNWTTLPAVPAENKALPELVTEVENRIRDFVEYEKI